jgi:hypothetical protein
MEVGLAGFRMIVSWRGIMESIIYPAITCIYFLLSIFAFRLFRESSLWGTLWTLFILFTLFFDSLVLSLGNLLGEGAVLEVLSQIRLLLYVLLFPTLIFVSRDQLRKIHVPWMEHYYVRISFHIYTAIVTVIGILVHYQWILLVPVDENGIFRYEAAEQVFPWQSLLGILSLLWAGWIYWKRINWSLLFMGAAISMFGVIVGYYVDAIAIRSISELILMGTTLLTDYRMKQEDYQEIICM